MAELNDSPCSSDHDEYSDPLEANPGARLSIPEKAGIFRKRKVQTNPASWDYSSSNNCNA